MHPCDEHQLKSAASRAVASAAVVWKEHAVSSTSACCHGMNLKKKQSNNESIKEAWPDLGPVDEGLLEALGNVGTSKGLHGLKVELNEGRASGQAV